MSDEPMSILDRDVINLSELTQDLEKMIADGRGAIEVHEIIEAVELFMSNGETEVAKGDLFLSVGVQIVGKVFWDANVPISMYLFQEKENRRRRLTRMRQLERKA